MGTLRDLEETWSFDDLMMAGEVLDALEDAQARAEASRG